MECYYLWSVKLYICSARERDRIITGLIKFGFILLNVADSKFKETNAEKLWNLGRHILIMTVKKKNDVIDSAVQEISMNIIGQKKMQFIGNIILNILNEIFISPY